MYEQPNRRCAVAAVLVAVALTAIAVAWPTQDKGAVVGVRTGEYQDGVAVYRLPTITVSVKRSEELAKMAREEAIASNARQ